MFKTYVEGSVGVFLDEHKTNSVALSRQSQWSQEWWLCSVASKTHHKYPHLNVSHLEIYSCCADTQLCVF